MKNKFFSILLSLAVAVGLWVYVVTEVDPEYTRSYRVQVDPAQFQYYSVMEERHLQIMEIDQYVTVQLRGDRTTLASIRNEDLTIKASLANVTKADEYFLEYEVNVPNGVLIEEQNPKKISIRVEEMITKPLTIKAEKSIVGEVPSGFYAHTDNVFLDEEGGTITITGPSSVVSKIEYAKLDGTIDLTGKEEEVNGEYDIVLCNKSGKPVDAKGVTILGSEKVAIRIRVEKEKEVKLDFEIIEGGGLTREDVTWEPATITVRGPKAAVDAMSDILILGQINLATMDIEKPLEPFPVDLKDDRLTNLSGIEEVLAVVDTEGLSQKTITIQNFDIQEPVNLRVEVSTQKIKVVLRGPKAVLSTLTASDVTAVVDYREAKAGAGVVRKPRITMNSAKFQDVAVISVSEVTAAVK